MLSENELWLLSYYRHSEISGALFFGSLLRIWRTGNVGRDLTKHTADESAHAWYWTQAINDHGQEPIRVDKTYQEQYMDAIGMPVSLMEILAVTQTFEKRIINQYARHAQVEGLDPITAATLKRIMEDEKWHIQWIQQALKDMEPEYGKDVIEATLKRYADADKQVYARTLLENDQRMEVMFNRKPT